MPPGMSPRGKKQEKQPSPTRGLRFGSPLGYILLLVVGFMLFRNVFQDAGVQRKTYSEFRTAIQPTVRGSICLTRSRRT